MASSDTQQFSASLGKESAALVDAIRKANLKPYYESTLEEARERSETVAKTFGGITEFDGERTEVFVPSNNIPGTGIPTFVYTPKNLRENPPIWIYFHGGGLIVGSRTNGDVLCKIIAQQAGCITVNVEYRLGPEHQIPAMMEDGCDVANWVMKNKLSLGGSAGSAVGVGGDSGGGTVTACVAHEVPGLAFQILIYPRVTHRFHLVSHVKYEHDPVINRSLINWLEGQSGDVSDVRYSSLDRDKFDHLPKTLFIVAECDPLCDESYEYSKKLSSAGVPNHLYLIKGAVHGFFHLTGFFKESCGEAYAHVTSFLKTF